MISRSLFGPLDSKRFNQVIQEEEYRGLTLAGTTLGVNWTIPMIMLQGERYEVDREAYTTRYKEMPW